MKMIYKKLYQNVLRSAENIEKAESKLEEILNKVKTAGYFLTLMNLPGGIVYFMKNVFGKDYDNSKCNKALTWSLEGIKLLGQYGICHKLFK